MLCVLKMSISVRRNCGRFMVGWNKVEVYNKINPYPKKNWYFWPLKIVSSFKGGGGGRVTRRQHQCRSRKKCILVPFTGGPVKIVSAAAQLSGNALGNKIPQKRKITKQMK